MRQLLLTTLFSAALLCGCPARDGDPTAATPASDTDPIARVEGQPPAAAGVAPVEVRPPAGATVLPDGQFSGRPGADGMYEWRTPFVYDGSFEHAAADLEQQLAPLGWERVIGPVADVTPQYTHGQGVKPTRAEGRRTYIAPDRLALVRLEYEFARGADGAADTEGFGLQVLSFAQPQPISASNRTEPLP